MVSMERKMELQDLWGNETNEDWTQEWRDDLSEEELALVDQWDKQYDSGICRMRLDILQRMDEGEADLSAGRGGRSRA